MNFIQPNWPAPRHIKAYTTVRSAWSARTEGEPLKTLLNLPEEPIWLKQTHSAIALPATPENLDKNGDASFTSATNRVCIALTADCLPVLITNRQGTAVAAIHAGWRGLSAGVIEETLHAMHLPEEDVLIWLGPAIGPQKFEVGKDVYDAFISRHEESASAFMPHAEGKWLANLYELARIRLRLRGITQIYGGDFCTYSQPDLFFSFRRDKGKQGNMANLIWIEG
jgi:YfiH family protein